MEYFIAFIVGVISGYLVTKFLYVKQFAEILNELGVTEDEITELSHKAEGKEPEMPSVDVKVEKHGEQLYAYRIDDDKFLGQADNPTALINRIAESMPIQVRLNISKENGSGYLESLVEDQPAK